MKNWKKNIVFIAALVLCFGLSACSGRSSSDDSDNTVAESYWYPDGNRNSLNYIKIQRDTLYWYEFNQEQGDVQVGEADGIVFKLSSKRRLKSGQTFTYTDTSKLNFEDCKICFEDDATEYYWRER